MGQNYRVAVAARMVAAVVVEDMDHCHSLDTDRQLPVERNPEPAVLIVLRRIPVVRMEDTSVYWRVDIDLAVRAGTDPAVLVHTDRERRTDSLLVVPDREHLVVVKPVDMEHLADTVAAEGQRDHRRDCSH